MAPLVAPRQQPDCWQLRARTHADPTGNDAAVLISNDGQHYIRDRSMPSQKTWPEIHSSPSAVIFVLARRQDAYDRPCLFSARSQVRSSAVPVALSILISL